MRYLEFRVRQANKNLSNDAFTKITNINELISPIPRGFINGNRHKFIYEENPSLTLKPTGDVGFMNEPILYDFALGTYFTELLLIQELEKLDDNKKISGTIANKIKKNYLNSIKLEEEYKQYKNNLSEEEKKEISSKYNWSLKTINSLKLFKKNNNFLFTFPIFNNGQLLAYTSYNPNKSPKWVNNYGTEGKIIINYDNFILDNEDTIICEGVKDFITLYDKGFNAIALTNGAGGVPELYVKEWKDRNFNIIYDNDDAGINGARNLAMFLFESGAKNIKIIDLSNVCIEKGEDIFDYFNKYHKTNNDLKELIKNTIFYTPDQYKKDIEKKYPTRSIEVAKNKENHNKIFRTTIQVNSEIQISSIIPETVKLKIETKELKYDWIYEIKSPRDFFKLFVKETTQLKLLKNMAYNAFCIHNPKEHLELNKYLEENPNIKLDNIIKIKIESTQIIYRYDVSENFGMFIKKHEMKNVKLNFVYSLENKLEIGNRYSIEYYITYHPDNKSEAIIIILKVIPLDILEKKLELTKEQFNELKKFQVKENQTLKERLDEHFFDLKKYIGFKTDKKLFFVNEITYHSVFEYTSLNNEIKLGMIRTSVFGDAGFGKTYIFEKLGELYQQGYYLSANNTSVAGLIGGQTQTSSGANVIKLGVAPSQDKGMLVLEEFTHSNVDLLNYLTDLLDSGRTHVSKVAGSSPIVARLRWLFIANDKSNQLIKTYKTGIDAFRKLFSKLEWERRIDLALAVDISTQNSVDKLNFENTELDYEKSLYKLKLDWVWSRTAENIVLSKDVINIGWELAQKWINKYGKIALTGSTDILFFNKLCKVACAIAGIVFSTNDGINLDVKKEHFMYAYKFYQWLYDNPTFNITYYTKLNDQISNVVEKDTEWLKKQTENDINFKQFIDNLSNADNNINQQLLRILYGAGLMFNSDISELLRRGFLFAKNYNNFEITQKFRSTIKLILTNESNEE